MFNQKEMTVKLDDTTTFIMEKDSSVDDKYHTTCLIDDGDDNFYTFHGVGDTPDEAIDNLISNMKDEEKEVETEDNKEFCLDDCSKEELIDIICEQVDCLEDQDQYIEDLERENKALKSENETLKSENLILQEKIDDLFIDLKQANVNYDTLKNLFDSNFSTMIKKISDKFVKEFTEVLS